MNIPKTHVTNKTIYMYIDTNEFNKCQNVQSREQRKIISFGELYFAEVPAGAGSTYKRVIITKGTEEIVRIAKFAFSRRTVRSASSAPAKYFREKLIPSASARKRNALSARQTKRCEPDK